MREPRIGKITINMGIGNPEDIANAETILKQLTDAKPVRTFSKSTIPGFNIRKNQEMGCKVTLRKKDAYEFLKRILPAVESTIKESSFDENGNFSFGINEHIEIAGMKYDPKIGILGMDICVAMERPGYRVARRKRRMSKIPRSHKLNKNDSIEFIKKKFEVNIVGNP